MMTLDILGIGAHYGNFPSRHAFEHAVYHGLPSTQEDQVDPLLVAVAALKDTRGSGEEVGVIHDRSLDFDRLREAWTAPLVSLGPVEGKEGTLFAAWSQAREWLQSHPEGRVLIVLGVPGGAGALVLAKSSSPSPPGYATGATLAVGPSLERACKDALDEAGISPLLVGYAESIAPLREGQGSPLTALQEIYSRPEDGPRTAASSLAPVIPDPTGMASLLKTIFAVHRRTLYKTPLDDHDGLPQTLEESSFYICPRSRPWLDAHPEVGRVAAVFGPAGKGGGFGQLVVTEADRRRPLARVRKGLQQDPAYLIPFLGSDRGQIQRSLSALLTKTRGGRPLPAIAADAYAQSKGVKERYRGSLIARDRDQLQQEIERAQKGLEQALSSRQAWSTPRGSYFTGQPLGESGVAFVYPGAFNSYPGMGRDLFQIFPSLHDQIKILTEDISHSLAETFLYPREIKSLSKEEEQALARNFFQHPVELIESGISLSVLHTLILKNIFQLHPDAAFGYSLGEISMLWANDIWQNASQSSNAWQRSPLFQEQLFGPKTAVREHWGMPASRGEDEFWGSYILKAPREDVQAAVEKRQRVYLTIINAPGEVVIAGWDPACREVIEALDCHALPMPFDAVIHNPAMQSTYQEFVDLYTNEVRSDPGIDFYSAAHYQPLQLEKDRLARQIARMTCEQVNFPRLVRTVYGDGPRIFVEVGPQKTCSRWIEKILGDQPHAVIPINKKYQEDGEGVLKVLSMLHSHQVPLDLSPLYGYSGQRDATHPQPPSGQNGKEGSLQGHSWPEPAGRTPEQPSPPAQMPGETEVVPASDAYTRYYQDLDRVAARAAEGHRLFLDHQEQALQQMGELMEMKLALAGTAGSSLATRGQPLYDQEDIRAFTLGDPQECFGPSYAIFEGRRIPRLPNGPFRFIDRVTAISGESGQVSAGSWLESEFDLPARAWYLEDEKRSLPYVALMEIALQPCGFLSAYLGSTFDKPHTDFYFRNLDGVGHLMTWPKNLGPTIHNRVELLSTSRMGEIIIQKYAFQLQNDGQTFYEGETSFGYFTATALKNQVGLDQGQRLPTWKAQHPERGSWTLPAHGSSAEGEPTQPRLPVLEKTWVSPRGGKFDGGYIYLAYPIHPQAWYFDAHFYQDPVMPGSLGVELMTRAVQKSATALGLPGAAHCQIQPGSETSWRYRGQVTREARRIQVEVHLKDLQQRNGRTVIIADGNLYNDQLRIYHVKDLAWVLAS